MSQAGFGSRRESEAAISAGRVTVNGRTARLGEKADLQSDIIKVDGIRLQLAEQVCIKLNKPKGVISSTEDEMKAGRTTVRDLVDYPGFLFLVGRLDKQSEGLMLLTNDGQLTHRLTHPSFEHEKVYHVELEGILTDEAIQLWREGVMLDGRKTSPAKIELIRRDGDRTRLVITLREGRKRQIRRLAAALGHPVLRLCRTAIGPIELGDLKSGEWRQLDPEEQSILRASVFTEEK